MQHTVLVVDDNKENLKFQKNLLESKGYSVHQAPNGQFAASLIAKNKGRYSLVLLDYHMPGMMGTEAAKLFQSIDRDLQIISISGDDSDDAFEKNLKAGSLLLLNRSISSQRLLCIVESYCQKFQERKICFGSEQLLTKAEDIIRSFGMVGASSHLVQVCALVDRYAKSDSSILIRGENGTGKERVARSIHEKSKVGSGPFVSVNCSAISEGLIESELFGHTKGAFTGAMRDRAGYFREASKGTLFLDEIGDMPMGLQVKLLRVLQEKEITPVGSTKAIKVDARVIAATNVNLEKAIKNGTFREDLFYRLNVLPIELKALRSRPEDIEPLVRHFLEQWRMKTGEKKEIRADVIPALKGQSWPGNVRQLENVMSRMLIRVEGSIIEYKHFIENMEGASELPETRHLLASYQGLRAEFQHREREILANLIRHTGSLSKAAKSLQIAKSTLSEKLKNLGVILPKTQTEESV